MVTVDDVRSICLSLPGVTERLSWKQPAWFARTLMARMWDEDTLTVKTTEREALAALQPDLFYWTPHHDRSPLLLLARMELLPPDELTELLQESYRLAGRLPPTV
ncbi:MmcQ/YjbR family DNA-binding protein [Arthrobacter sp. zg-Y769]|uniref:MmcQ/YjbR family DNA-binding protein n=1 Tax=Arthrobacter sp. zg-Y769 TaxID=2894191 RepID=UPI001E5ECD2E|nr:MmcQ/YjbR family DNA-binding protein [Arthrobacter sp. zg-Y769]MCC9203441.1 MmcQ/YjbR family DNA-binding protein [Arthrobacter sp. zg-Y769]